MRRGTPGIAYVFAVLIGLLYSPHALGQTVYVANAPDDTVSVIDPQTGATLAPPIPVGQSPHSIAISPDGRRAAVANTRSGYVSLIDTSFERAVENVPVEYEPHEVAIAPNDTLVVTSGTDFDDGAITMFDLATGQFVGKPIPYEHRVHGLAVTPDGHTALVTTEQGRVLYVDLLTDRIVGETNVGGRPLHIAVTPDGRYAVVPLFETDAVSVIDLSTRSVVGEPIPVGGSPYEVAISPDGRFAYIGSVQLPTPSVTKIDLAAHRVVASAQVEGQPWGITLSPDGSVAYLTSEDKVEMIDTSSLQRLGSPVEVGFQAEAIAAIPAQPPQASFIAPSGGLGVPTEFAANPLSSPSAIYEWNFGDGGTAAGAVAEHTYASAGNFPVTLRVSDKGCSTAPIFTGQTAYCNGSALASNTQTVTVPAAPVARKTPSSFAVRVACPREAEKALCRFKLRAVAGKGKGAPSESTVVRTTVRRGKSKVVDLEPRPRFAAKLALVPRVLIRVSRSIGRSTHTATHWLAVVH